MAFGLQNLRLLHMKVQQAKPLLNLVHMLVLLHLFLLMKHLLPLVLFLLLLILLLYGFLKLFLVLRLHIFHVLVFVYLLYLIKSLFHFLRWLPKFHHNLILFRIVNISFSCIFCSLLTYEGYVLNHSLSIYLIINFPKLNIPVPTQPIIGDIIIPASPVIHNTINTI